MERVYLVLLEYGMLQKKTPMNFKQKGLKFLLYLRLGAVVTSKVLMKKTSITACA